MSKTVYGIIGVGGLVLVCFVAPILWGPYLFGENLAYGMKLLVGVLIGLGAALGVMGAIAFFIWCLAR
jgi:hypothetical protein